MNLNHGQVAVVTGAASGIGFAVATAFAQRGLNVVLADVQEDALEAAAEQVAGHGVNTLAVTTDVSNEASVRALAQATIDRFDGVHVVCNNAGVGGAGEPWFSATSAWEWVINVNLWGVIHGVRAFLPHLVTGGHIVNTSSIAGVMPAFGAPYSASKHAVVAISECLYNDMTVGKIPVGVSVLCPGWVRTAILDSQRNWPAELGAVPETPGGEVAMRHARRAIDEGMTPAAVAGKVVSAVEDDRFWIFPEEEWFDLAVRRFGQVAEQLNPAPPEQFPGMPPTAQMIAEMTDAQLP